MTEKQKGRILEGIEWLSTVARNEEITVQDKMNCCLWLGEIKGIIDVDSAEEKKVGFINEEEGN